MFSEPKLNRTCPTLCGNTGESNRIPECVLVAYLSQSFLSNDVVHPHSSSSAPEPQVKNMKPCQCHALPSSSPSSCFNTPLAGQKIYLCSSPPSAPLCSHQGSRAVYSSVSAVLRLSAPAAFNVLLTQLLISRWLR